MCIWFVCLIFLVMAMVVDSIFIRGNGAFSFSGSGKRIKRGDSGEVERLRCLES